MPIYEYECRKCGNRFDKICISDTKDEEIDCPNCKGNNCKRKISLFSSKSSAPGSSTSGIGQGFT
ncbi:MAG: zinc ribbon domain-containing protein [Candidatus Eremiobacteraeota bacterium]|nr:zinc ribbon domain-containing protein [Candidatus Eremiobacteraeota bacterium]